MKKIIAAVVVAAFTLPAVAGPKQQDFSLESAKITTTSCTTNGNRTSCTSW